jgi:hypothetical protein
MVMDDQRLSQGSRAEGAAEEEISGGVTISEDEEVPAIFS